MGASGASSASTRPDDRGSAHVPVSMCSPSFRTVDVRGFLISEVWFPPGTFIPRHTHARPVFGVMLEGGFEDRFATRTLDPGAGECFTEPGEERHANQVGARGARVLALQPDPADEELLSRTRDLLDEIRSLRHAGVADTAWRLSREIVHPDGLAGLAIESLALDMLVAATRFEAGSAEPAWLARVDEIVHDAFAARLSVAEIAREVGVHRAHLARVYKRHRGLSIGAHVRQLRLVWAADQLDESSESLSAIALRAGFSDQSHFTREFKRRFGIPPGAYRRARRSVS